MVKYFVKSSEVRILLNDLLSYKYILPTQRKCIEKFLIYLDSSFESSQIDSKTSVKYKVKQGVFRNSFSNISIPNGNNSKSKLKKVVLND